MIKNKVIKLPISKFIDTKYRDYSVYVLESRGIPSFFDALTPVQRYILMNTPQSFTKTLSVVGDCMKGGYHHGDCIEYSTKINLADGTQVTIGEWAEKYPEAELLVKSVDENNNEVIGIANNPRVGYITDEYYEIELENGEIIKCTSNHPFLVNEKWVKAEDLQEKEDIFDLSHDDIYNKDIYHHEKSKKCKNCGSFFLPNHINENIEYCSLCRKHQKNCEICDKEIFKQGRT